MNNNYYQSDIKTSRQEDSIYAMRYVSQQMLIDKLKKQLKAYENMRKEAYNTLTKSKEYVMALAMELNEKQSVLIQLANILNKVGEDNDTN